MPVVKLIQAVGWIIAAVIAVGVLLVVADANEGNALVAAMLDVGRFFTDPFRRIIDLERGKEHLQIAINWGIAAVAYVLVASLVAGALRAVAERSDRGGRRECTEPAA